MLECCARVSSDGKAAILGRSGSSGVFAADLANAGPKPQVEWITCGETVGPAYLRLAGNKAAEKKSSLAFRRGGGAALGVRLLGTDSPARVCAWRARHVPRSWTPDEVAAALQDVGFTEYNLLSPGQGQLPWLFKAKLTDDTGQSALAIQFGKVTVDIERAAAKRRMVDVEAVRVRPTREQKASSPPSLSAAPSVPTTATGPATTPAPLAVDGQIPQRGRPHSSEKSARDRSRSNRSKAEPWFEVIDCGGAGNCYFNCVGASYAVSRDKFNWKDAQRLANTRGCALRAELAIYIREKAAAFKPFWLPPEEPQTEAECLNLKQAEGGEPLYTWEAYLAGLDRPKRWVSDIAMVGSVDKPSQIISFGKKIDWEDRPQVVIPLLYWDKHYQLRVTHFLRHGLSWNLVQQAWCRVVEASHCRVDRSLHRADLQSAGCHLGLLPWLPLRALELQRTLGCRRGLLLRLLRLLVGTGLWGDGFLLGLLQWLLRALGLQRTLGCRRGPLPRTAGLHGIPPLGSARYVRSMCVPLRLLGSGLCHRHEDPEVDTSTFPRLRAAATLVAKPKGPASGQVGMVVLLVQKGSSSYWTRAPGTPPFGSIWPPAVKLLLEPLLEITFVPKLDYVILSKLAEVITRLPGAWS